MSADPVYVSPFPALNPPFKAPPFNLDAEQELLGAVMVNNHAAMKISAFLLPEHFHHEAHRRIYAAITALIDRGDIANPVTLKAYFEQDEVIAKAGGTSYLARLAAGATTVINAEDYARVIHDLAQRRAGIAALEQHLDLFYSPSVDTPAPVLLEQLEADIRALDTSGSNDGHKLAQAGGAAAESVHRLEQMRQGLIRGISSGLTDLDRRIGGFMAPDLVVMAGRPSMGKTAEAIAIGFNAAKLHFETSGADGAAVAIFSLEQSAQQLTDRILSMMTAVPYERIRRGHVDDAEFGKIDDARRVLDQYPLFICDRGAITPAGMRSEILRLNAKLARQLGPDGKPKRIGLVVVDYLQLCGPSKNRNGNKVLEVGDTTAGLKELAKKLAVCVLALSQLSRAVESRDDKRPQLADLRESGAIEQDADTVIMVYRHAYYLGRAAPDPGRDAVKYAGWEAEMAIWANTVENLIPKNRHGPIGTARFEADLPTNRFYDIGSNPDASTSPAAASRHLRGAAVDDDAPAYATEFAPI